MTCITHITITTSLTYMTFLTPMTLITLMTSLTFMPLSLLGFRLYLLLKQKSIETPESYITYSPDHPR